MNVTGIDATYYVVTDIDGTTKFYTQLLGAEPAMRHGPVSEWTFADGSSFGLYQTEGTAGSNGSAMFAVPDVAAAVALEKRGVPALPAGLAAELGIRAYYRAYEQWADSPGEQTLTDFARHSLNELRAASATLD